MMKESHQMFDDFCEHVVQIGKDYAQEENAGVWIEPSIFVLDGDFIWKGELDSFVTKYKLVILDNLEMTDLDATLNNLELFNDFKRALASLSSPKVFF